MTGSLRPIEVDVAGAICIPLDHAELGEDFPLIVVVGDPEPAFDPDRAALGPEHFDTERMDGGPSHGCAAVTQLPGQPAGHLLGGFVGVGHRANPGGIESLFLDQKPDLVRRLKEAVA